MACWWSGRSGERLRCWRHALAPFDEALRLELLGAQHAAAATNCTAPRSPATPWRGVTPRWCVLAACRRRRRIGGRHRRARPDRAPPPLAFDGNGYTLQLNNPALLAERTGIDVVADLRSRDVAAGGPGRRRWCRPSIAQYSPAARPWRCSTSAASQPDACSAPTGAVLGFDCGPANACWTAGCSAIAASPSIATANGVPSGRSTTALLAALQSEPFFDPPPPKSTGRDLFHAEWLARPLASSCDRAGDVQATLAELTAWACAREAARHPRRARVAGVRRRCLQRPPDGAARGPSAGRAGGLDQRSAACRPTRSRPAPSPGWRAPSTREPASLPSVTGARGARVLGALYPR